MKIAHVVTYVSPDGAFGGPTRVALGQAKALASMGHDVTVFAGSPPDAAGDRTVDGYRLRTFPVTRIAPLGGFAALLPRGMRAALSASARTFDVGHLHLARDLVTLPAAQILRRASIPYLTQSHGMITKPKRPLATVIDLALTRRALESAGAWLVLTEDEKEELTAVARPRTVHAIRNGIERDDPAPLSGRSNTVLFLARLHERKRPTAFVEMAESLLDRLPETQFVLVGPDEGEGLRVQRMISAMGVGERIKWVGSLPPSDTAGALRDARAYVLPSVNEVFPMSILEAFVAGTPVITTNSLGIAPQCRSFGAAVVTDGSVEDLAQATYDVVTNSERALELREGARRYLDAELDVAAVAREVESRYSEVILGGRHR